MNDSPTSAWLPLRTAAVSGGTAPIASAGSAHSTLTSGGLTGEIVNRPSVTATTPEGR